MINTTLVIRLVYHNQCVNPLKRIFGVTPKHWPNILGYRLGLGSLSWGTSEPLTGSNVGLCNSRHVRLSESDILFHKTNTLLNTIVIILNTNHVSQRHMLLHCYNSSSTQYKVCSDPVDLRFFGEDPQNKSSDHNPPHHTSNQTDLRKWSIQQQYK